MPNTLNEMMEVGKIANIWVHAKCQKPSLYSLIFPSMLFQSLLVYSRICDRARVIYWNISNHTKSCLYIYLCQIIDLADTMHVFKQVNIKTITLIYLLVIFMRDFLINEMLTYTIFYCVLINMVIYK